VQSDNLEASKALYTKFVDAFKCESRCHNQHELVSSSNMHKISNDFVAAIDQKHNHDLKENHEWYMANSYDILMDINYPSKAEKEFLRQLELWQ
jgi:hypothetical protein